MSSTRGAGLRGEDAVAIYLNRKDTLFVEIVGYTSAKVRLLQSNVTVIIKNFKIE